MLNVSVRCAGGMMTLLGCASIIVGIARLDFTTIIFNIILLIVGLLCLFRPRQVLLPFMR
jgi:hypothetical protein